MNKKSLLVSIIAVLLPAISIAGSWNGWISQSPYPTSLNLFDAKFISPAKGWVTGKFGSIFYTEDGGDTWESQESGTEEDLMRIAFVNEKAGWAVGERGTIIHTEDGGKTWVNQYNANALLTKVFFINEKEGWVTGATPMAVVLYTRNGGKTWEQVDTGINRAIASIYFINSQTGWILAGDEVYRTEDGGKKWEKSVLPRTKYPERRPRLEGGMFPNIMEDDLGPDWWYGDVVFANEKEGWAVIGRWFIFHTEDGGKTWATQLDTGYMTFGFGHVSFRDVQNGCVSGTTIFCTDDGGKTWNERVKSADEGLGLGGISMVGKTGGWVAGNNGDIRKTEDKGKSWKDILKWDKCGEYTFFINDNTRWLWDYWDGDICRTNDSGQTWEHQNVGLLILDLFFVDDSFGWAVGSEIEGKDRNNPDKVYQVVKRTTDGGKTWETQLKELIDKKNYHSINLLSLYFIDRTAGWIVGTKGTVLRTKNGGANWERQQSGTKLDLRRVHFSDAKKGIVMGDIGSAIGEDSETDKKAKGVILYTEDGGKHWRVAWERRPVLMSDLFFIDKDKVWVTVNTLEEALLLYSEDSGKTWLEKHKLSDINSNYYSPVYFLDKNRGVLFLQGDALVGNNKRLLVTTDGGKTWSKRHIPLKKHPWHISEMFEKGRNNPGGVK